MVVDATQVEARTVNAVAYALGGVAAVGWGGRDWNSNTVQALIGQSLAGECAVTDRVGTLGWDRLLSGESLRALDSSATFINHPTRGPVLQDMNGKVLWQVSVPAGLPGNLVAAGGSVRLVGRDGTILWDAAPGILVAGLALRGSLTDGTFELVVTAPGAASRKPSSPPTEPFDVNGRLRQNER